MIKNNKEKGFALVLSIILLIVMSLMGGSLIVISSGDHQSNNNSDHYQQTFYVAEAGLLEGEKWILDKYLGPWMNKMPEDDDVLGNAPTDPGPLSVYNLKVDIWQDTKTEYASKTEDTYFRHTFIRGPATNDTTIPRDSSRCLMSFKNLETDDDDNVKIIGTGQLPVQKSFLEIVGPLLCAGGYNGCIAADSTNFNTDDDVINETGQEVTNDEGETEIDFSSKEKFIKAEFNFLKRFAYEYFIINIGAAAYRNDGSSIATDVSNVDSQGTAYKIYACGILYGAGRGDDLHNGEIEILIPLENIVVMPT